MSTLKPAVSEKDHFEGGKSASIEIVEFGDYQCPHCGHAFPIIKKIQKIFGEQIKFIFRHFPLQEAHEYAFPAAVAAEAAALQGKFWEMHDGLYQNQNQLGENLFNEIAEKIGLDIDQFKKDYSSGDLTEKVESDFESGIRSGVNGTPSFYVNGSKFDGGAEDLLAMLKESAE
ncbi:DsbA family protein [Pedobacter aquatilis]|uniref:DsbA family protein n=1 Tax=Pedobacter aquatilis TaxID=351343 RepID=UPI0029316B3C|nr:thioredoxin domain-containing protein [Pedobacter aquatilis]